MKIGILLRKLRDRKNLSTRCIAERINVPQSTYMDWEHDRSSPALRFYDKLADAFEVCPVVLMSYLTGHISEISHNDNPKTTIELLEIVTYFKNLNLLLIEKVDRLENELVQIKQLIKS